MARVISMSSCSLCYAPDHATRDCPESICGKCGEIVDNCNCAECEELNAEEWIQRQHEQADPMPQTAYLCARCAAPPDETPALIANMPPVVLASLRRYAIDHVPVGSFLTAVLSNDLMQAVGRADACNLPALPDICRYVYGAMPSQCHGSAERVNEWIAKGD